MYKEIEGDLINRSLNLEFDVICHSVNCFSYQYAGIAKQMMQTFQTNLFSLEINYGIATINKLGQIDYEGYDIKDNKPYLYSLKDENEPDLYVVNLYSQYEPGANVDYDALRLCLRKVNHIFKGKKIGLPKLSCGIAGGIWEHPEANDLAGYLLKSTLGKDVKTIIKEELKDCDVTIVIYDK